MADGRLDVVDYSWARPSHAALKAYGVKGVMRYLYPNGKGLTPAEVQEFRESGLSLGLNYEAGAGDFVGRTAGRDQAITAASLAASLGLSGNVIIFSADFDSNLGTQEEVGDALQGALDVLGRGRAGVYGEADLIDHCYSRFGADAYYWQTYAWSNGRRSTHADLYQFRNAQTIADASVDFNEITGRTFWALGTGGSHAVTNGAAVALDPPPAHPAASRQEVELMLIDTPGKSITIPIPQRMKAPVVYFGAGPTNAVVRCLSGSKALGVWHNLLPPQSKAPDADQAVGVVLADTGNSRPLNPSKGDQVLVVELKWGSPVTVTIVDEGV